MFDQWPHLLVPVDFRPAAREALRVALEMASGMAGGVTLLHVTPPAALGDLDAIGYLHRASRLLQSAGAGPELTRDAPGCSAAALRRLEQELHPEWRRSVPIQLAVRSGDVAAEVARYAAEAAVERVVVGVNRSGWRLSLWPRHSERIVRRSDRPVVLVHAARRGRCGPVLADVAE